MNPFIVLDLPRTCTDAQVRARYHELIRRFPPENAPREFQLIQEAATALKDARSRHRAHLFYRPHPPLTPLETVEQFARLPGRMRPPGPAAFKALLRACAAADRNRTS